MENIGSSKKTFPLSMWVGVGIIIITVSAGLFAPFLSPALPNTQVLELRNKPPFFSGNVIYFRHREHLPVQAVAVKSFSEDSFGIKYVDFMGRTFFKSNEKLEKIWLKSFVFILGSDQFGRDVLSRILYGARTSLAVGLCASTLSMLIGVFLGGAAGYFGNRLEKVIMRFTDIMFGFPVLLFLISFTALFEPSLMVIFVAIGFVTWPGMARLVRSQVLSIKTQDYILAARTVGTGSWHIMVKHVFPNCLSPILITYSIGVGSAILAEASLSFLGLGAQPPTPSWGSMINMGKDFIRSAPWVSIVPGIAIGLTVLGFNLVGDGLRDYFDPKMDITSK